MADPQQNATAVGWQQAELFADGGSRGNPGPSGIGFYLQAVGEPGQDRSQPADVAGALLTPLASGGWYLGPATNNQAEYQALIWALQNAREFQVRHLSIRMDSELVVRQLTGQYQVKNPGIKPFYNEAQRLLQQFASVEIIQVPREQNSIADQLANAAMDSSGPVGNYPVAYQQPPTQLDLA
ncbi:MAG: ribonuclease HI family protein, partial [Actinomycetia bacterium]|nr:ribonuclease HI family protein [Actinomycetes bacterium]